MIVFDPKRRRGLFRSVCTWEMRALPAAWTNSMFHLVILTTVGTRSTVSRFGQDLSRHTAFSWHALGLRATARRSAGFAWRFVKPSSPARCMGID